MLKTVFSIQREARLLLTTAFTTMLFNLRHVPACCRAVIQRRPVSELLTDFQRLASSDCSLSWGLIGCDSTWRTLLRCGLTDSLAPAAAQLQRCCCCCCCCTVSSTNSVFLIISSIPHVHQLLRGFSLAYYSPGQLEQNEKCPRHRDLPSTLERKNFGYGSRNPGCDRDPRSHQHLVLGRHSPGHKMHQNQSITRWHSAKCHFKCKKSSAEVWILWVLSSLFFNFLCICRYNYYFE